MVLSNQTVLIEQYANNRGPVQEVRGALFRRSGGQSPPDAETLLAFVHSMEATNLPAF